jgi:hypothetical protein
VVNAETIEIPMDEFLLDEEVRNSIEEDSMMIIDTSLLNDMDTLLLLLADNDVPL